MAFSFNFLRVSIFIGGWLVVYRWWFRGWLWGGGSVGLGIEPLWDDLEVVDESNEATEQSKGRTTTAEEDSQQDTDSKALAQQRLTKTDDQLTLQALTRTTPDSFGTMEGGNGISTHGPSYLGPRSLLTITDNPQESVLKVTQSADTA